VTLRDGGDYITSLPKAEQDLAEWQTAIGCLLGAAEGRGFLMHARIGVLRALNRYVEPAFNPDRKDTHWGKRRLKRPMKAVWIYVDTNRKLPTSHLKVPRLRVPSRNGSKRTIRWPLLLNMRS
jgi:hypothetical protein